MRRYAMLALVAAAAGCASPATPTSPAAPAPPPVEQGCGAETRYDLADPALADLQLEFRPVLQANRKAFTGSLGPVRGFGAGAVYPQVWLRDSATLLPATRYLYPREYLVSWLDEHLVHQRANGELFDWIAAGEVSEFSASAPQARLVYDAGGVRLTADKNTTVTDQEASAVDAAWSVFQVTGDRAWLAREVGGTPLVDRLDAAMAAVLAERLDRGSGLVTTAFTADWGDVSTAYPDQRAIYRDERTPVVVSLSASAFFARAAEQLAELQEEAGRGGRAGKWRGVAAATRRAINERLWQPDRGFYRLHDRVEGGGELPPFDDSDVFALGGNALAALYEAAEVGQAERIFTVAQARRRQYGLATVAGSLLPPYPVGFFSHPLLREPYSYQNGGQWDWWAGRLVLAMFRRGAADAAYEELLAIARRAVRAGGLYEWYTTENLGRGSPSYAGNVGALAGALYLGLFGLSPHARGLDITVRLGGVSGGVRVCEPASERRIAYDYAVEEAPSRARLRFEANVPGEGRLAIRLPGGRDPARVRLDGREIPYGLERVGRDLYLAVRTDWSPHVLEMTLE